VERDALQRYFPHCDFYDVGLREAVQYVCARAERGAQLLLESPYVAGYYLKTCGRTDITVLTLSKPGQPCAPDRACYYVLQESNRHFETQHVFDALRERPADALVQVHGVPVAEIYGTRPKPPPGRHAARLLALAEAFGNAPEGPPVELESRSPPRMPGEPLRGLAVVSRFRFAGGVSLEESGLLPLNGPGNGWATP
jgi:hypothetical protein